MFAIVTPIDCGYLSVRIKPSSEIFTLIQTEYANILEHEQRVNSPEESAACVLNRISELGFADYTEFAATALIKEVQARNQHLNKAQDRTLEAFSSLVTYSKSIAEHANNILNAYTESVYVPLNLRIKSIQLGEEGKSIEVISGSYREISREIQEHLLHFTQSTNEIYKLIYHSMFISSIAKLQQELAHNFINEERDEDITIDYQEEIEYLNRQKDTYMKSALSCVRKILSQITVVKDQCSEMKRLSASLEVIRIMGKVESAKISNTQDGLLELIQDLDVFQELVSTNLKELERATNATSLTTERIHKNFSNVA